ncbi:uncharacterized protein LOC112567209 [Pomacea canaliculata]|uniref:uncharacterized protein LOC112567209 n=1 Tax=Pomacea canaliculata TaxID=400727 RepID=UPI000D73264A|nr:uncharacterized protein LOC112567209 [Pomacea canaliculata]XP_025099601.1 uncharacterized protein LOC112567209 [Pomacea canaliculata]
MTKINFSANICLLIYLIKINIIVRTSDTNKSEEDNITKSTVLPDYLPFSLESTSVFDLNHTDRYSLPSAHSHLELQECAKHSHIYTVRGSEGSILISLTQTDNSHSSSVVFFCTIELQVSQGMVAHVRTFLESMAAINRVIITDEDNVVIFENYVNVLPTEFFTYSNIVRFQLMASTTKYSFRLNVNFTAVPQETQPQLNTTFLSPTTGYIDTSQPSEKKEYCPFINTWTYLVAPEDHATVINIYIYDKRQDCLINGINFVIIFETDSNSTQYSVCALYKNSYTEPVIYHGGVRVQYKSFTTYDRPFFRILFSFHHVSALPVQVSEGRWNCSAVRWEDMQHHFPCNFVSNCVGGEDEAGCWSGDGTCSPGTLQAGGRCFSLSFFGEEEMSWIDANEHCRKRGGQLPSLSTKRVWESVTDLFTRIGKCSHFFIGARTAPPTISVMYRNSWMWSDNTIAYFIHLYSLALTPPNTDLCTSLGIILKNYGKIPLLMSKCQDTDVVSCLLCEIPGTSSPYENNELPEIRTTSTSNFIQLAYVRCPDDHFTHVFLACDEGFRCWGGTDGATDSCPSSLTPLPPFQCDNVHQSVPYTLVCDHRADCKDGSDEDFCYFPPCDPLSPFRCAGGRCVQQWERCNGQVDCNDRADEDRCQKEIMHKYNTLDLELPLKIDLNSKGIFSVLPYIYNSSEMFFCPESHFTCVSLQQVCLPVYLRCNGVNDCPGHEDEAACDRYTCPGFYRCRASQVCVHESHVCDGIYHCPLHDDEILCNETCPDNCVCRGWAFGCSGIFHAASYPNLRYVNASGTSMNLIDFVSNIYLVQLNLIRCNITRLHEVTLPNLRILDLSSNKLTHISSYLFTGLTRLQSLKLSFNPLNKFSFMDVRQTSFLKFLDLSDVLLPVIDFRNIFFPH